MLQKVPAKIRTHSCPTRASIGWNFMNPGINCSVISNWDWVSSIRGSV